MALFDPQVAALVARLQALPDRLRGVAFWPSDDGASVAADDQVHAIPTVFACIDGVARILGGPDGRIDLQPGDCLVIAPGVRHRHAPLRRGSVCLDLGFVANVCDFDLGDHALTLWCRIPAEPYRGWCDRLLRADAAPRLALCRRMFAALAGERLEHMAFPHPAQRAMANRLWSNLPGLTADAILAASGLRPRRAHALFVEFFGATPKQALLAQRLGLAAWFLDAGFGIGEAAARAGFRRRADFTRAWTQRHRGPPSARVAAR
ncbi:MAG: helix-turn-helix domain-containing protein [Planctomycetes bacterium]|nr:helix-turn-helix domain-containing protein [Planctomycetota bacterium]